MATWSVPVLQIAPPKNPAALTDLIPLLDRLVSAFDIAATAQLLDVEPVVIRNWMSRQQPLTGEMATRVLDVHDVITRALQIFKPRTAMDWLVGHEPFLDHARPVDVLVTRGAQPLIESLRAMDAGGYA
jgi:uncharacterized protein (DUF2384 family)